MRRRVRPVVVAMVCLILAAAPARAQARTAPSVNADLTPFDRAKAESILQRQLPCLGCHTLRGEGGKLAPELSTVRERRDAEYVARMIANPQATVPGTLMPHTPMSAATRALIVRYLGGNASSLAALATAAPASSADTTGATLYAHYCTGCHGEKGNGDGPNAKSLPVPPARHASREAMMLRPDDSLYDTIAGGGAIMNRSPRMPAYGTTLTPAQIRALVRHIRSLCKCSGPAWSADGSGRG